MSIVKTKFGVTKEGKEVTRYTLKNSKGMEVSFLDLGAVITNIIVPDKNGVMEDVVLGYDTVADYEVNDPSFGAIVGRFANRISNASFTINGITYELDRNNESNCLHGGILRYNHLMYDAECQEREEGDSISFSRVSPHMEQGFPGNLTLTITYTLNDNNELMIEYYGVSDEDTTINLTNHSYFNIGVKGHQCKNVLNQQLQVFSEIYTPTDHTGIPTGEFRSVKGTALDFTQVRTIGDRIGEPTDDSSIVGGYDHNYVLETEIGDVKKAAVYSDKESGRIMEVYTDFPGLQIYTASGLIDPNGKDNTVYGNYSGICFETQNYPDAINIEGFPSAVLKAGEEYQRVAVFRFDTI